MSFYIWTISYPPGLPLSSVFDRWPWDTVASGVCSSDQILDIINYLFFFIEYTSILEDNMWLWFHLWSLKSMVNALIYQALCVRLCLLSLSPPTPPQSHLSREDSSYFIITRQNLCNPEPLHRPECIKQNNRWTRQAHKAEMQEGKMIRFYHWPTMCSQSLSCVMLYSKNLCYMASHIIFYTLLIQNPEHPLV